MDTSGHVSSVCALDSFLVVRFLRIVSFRRESVTCPERMLISFGLSDNPRTPAPLCYHGLDFLL